MQTGAITDHHVLAELRDRLESTTGHILPTPAWNEAASEFMAKIGAILAATDRPTRDGQDVAAAAIRSIRAPEFPRYGLAQMFVNAPPGRFAARNQNRSALHLRVVWRPDVGGGFPDRLSRPMSFVELAPQQVFDRWYDYYARCGGVGQLWPARPNPALTSGGCILVEQDCATSETSEPQASTRATVALYNGSSPMLRFVTDLMLFVPNERLPLGNVVASILDLAQQASTTMPTWFSKRYGTQYVGGSGVLEIHASGGGASATGNPERSLEEYVDLSLLGSRARNGHVSVAYAVRIDESTATAEAQAIADAFARSTIDWGYFDTPDDLAAQLPQIAMADRTS